MLRYLYYINKLWDLKKNKLLKDFHIMDQTTINCIDFNPFDINLVYGSNDKTLKHWDLERYDLVTRVIILVGNHATRQTSNSSNEIR
jgi:WD40 repeat protein